MESSGMNLPPCLSARNLQLTRWIAQAASDADCAMTCQLQCGAQQDGARLPSSQVSRLVIDEAWYTPVWIHVLAQMDLQPAACQVADSECMLFGHGRPGDRLEQARMSVQHLCSAPHPGLLLLSFLGPDRWKTPGPKVLNSQATGADHSQPLAELQSPDC